MSAPLRIAPIGWVVQSAKGRALVLERPAADQLAMRTHGTVDAAYSGEQVQQILEHTGKVVLVEVTTDGET